MKRCECYDCWEIKTYSLGNKYHEGLVRYYKETKDSYHANGYSFDTKEELEHYIKLKAFW